MNLLLLLSQKGSITATASTAKTLIQTLATFQKGGDKFVFTAF